jgi:stage III sporulation protein AF
LIQWLSEWLKQIVLLVLIATFMDLLLPNNAMERYVKLVMGLLIVMAILSPIFQLIKHDFDLTSLAFQQPKEIRGEMTSVETIRQQGKELQQQQDQWVKDQVESQLEKTIRQSVEKEFNVEVMEAQVVINTGEKGKSPAIRQLRIKIRPEPPPKDRTAMKPVEQIDPVRIQPGMSKDHSEKRKATTPEERRWRDRITRFLSESWKVEPRQVRVTVEGVS